MWQKCCYFYLYDPLLLSLSTITLLFNFFFNCSVYRSHIRWERTEIIWTEVCQAFALMVQYFHQAAFLLFKVQVSKEKRSCWILTDLCIESSLSVAGQVGVSWRRTEPFVWCFRIWENKHGDCTLIRDRNVAFTSIVPEPATPQSMTLHYMVNLEFLII